MPTLPIMPFARTARLLLRAYHRDTDPRVQRVHQTLLDSLLRHAPNRVYVSAAAQAKADRLGLGDLREYEWKHQKGRMGDKGRALFAWEHYYPVSELRRQLLLLRSPTETQIRRIMNRACIVWILRSENTKLNRDHRSERPNPRAAYEDAGIWLTHWRPSGKEGGRPRTHRQR